MRFTKKEEPRKSYIPDEELDADTHPVKSLIKDTKQLIFAVLVALIIVVAVSLSIILSGI